MLILGGIFMQFHLRDPNILKALIQAASIPNFNPSEKYELVWDGHRSYVYDITPSVHTLHFLAKPSVHVDLYQLFDGWKVINFSKLTFSHKNTMVTFHPEGIICVYSTNKCDRAFHAKDPQDVEKLKECLQQG